VLLYAQKVAQRLGRGDPGSHSRLANSGSGTCTGVKRFILGFCASPGHN
jgi:hypothetical protein